MAEVALGCMLALSAGRMPLNKSVEITPAARARQIKQQHDTPQNFLLPALITSPPVIPPGDQLDLSNPRARRLGPQFDQAQNFLLPISTSPPVIPPGRQDSTAFSVRRAGQRYDFDLDLLGTTLAPSVVGSPLVGPDWPTSRVAARAVRDDQRNLLLPALITSPPVIPPGETDGAVVQARRQAQTQDSTPYLLGTTLSQVPFTPDDWPTAATSKRPRTEEPPYLLGTTLAAPAAAAPFAVFDSSAARASRRVSKDDLCNLLLPALVTPPVVPPGRSSDLTQGRRAIASQPEIIGNLLGTTLAPSVGLPFTTFDSFQSRRTAARVADADQRLLGSTLSQVPLIQADWPSSRRAARVIQTEQPNLLANTLAPTTTVIPFASFEWPRQRPRIATQEAAFENLLTATLSGAPFIPPPPAPPTGPAWRTGWVPVPLVFQRRRS